MSTQLIHSSLNTIFWSAPAALAPRIKQNKLFGVSESIKIQTDEQLMIEYYWFETIFFFLKYLESMKQYSNKSDLECVKPVQIAYFMTGCFIFNCLGFDGL